MEHVTEGSVNVKLRGPEGVQARIQELEARLQSLAPPLPKAPTIGEFGKSLEGAIGRGEAPLNPFGAGSVLTPAGPPGDLKGKIETAAREAGIDPKLLDALVAQESSYDPNARSRAGAMGLTQLMPDTAKALGVSNPFDPDENLRAGAKYLSSLLKRFDDPALALAAYNAGPGRVERAGNQIPNISETQAYVQRVLAGYRARQG